MSTHVFFDHIEVHVEDIQKYCEFLIKIFQGGRYKIISDTGISMYKSNDGRLLITFTSFASEHRCTNPNTINKKCNLTFD